jgi:hypothetical protein
MANTKSGKRRAGIIALAAVIAAISVGPSTAAAAPGKSQGLAHSNAPANTSAPETASAPAIVVAPTPAAALETAPGLCIPDASWAE